MNTLPNTPNATIAYHVRWMKRSTSDGLEQVFDETVIQLSSAPVKSAVNWLRWAAEQAAPPDEPRDFLDALPTEEAVREPESIVTWMPHQPDHTAFGPTYRWGPLRLRAVRSGVPVIQPSHYNQHPCGFPAIDLLEFFPFNLGNALRYLWRADHKHAAPTDDIAKARWYFERETERLQRLAAVPAHRLLLSVFCTQLEFARPWADRVQAAEPDGLLGTILRAMYATFDRDYYNVDHGPLGRVPGPGAERAALTVADAALAAYDTAATP